MLFISNGPGNDPHNPSMGRVLSEADLKTARIADERIAEAFAQLDVGSVEEFRSLRDDLRWLHDTARKYKRHFHAPPRQRPPPALTLTPGSFLPPNAPRQPAGAAAAG